MLKLNYRYIGILGGSFDPPHRAHVMISLAAWRMLKLDKILWLITPQNPLKAHAPTPLAERLDACREYLKPYPHIIASDLETRLKTHYAIDTIRALKIHYPRTRVVWLMGSDNFTQLHHWKSWRAFIHETIIAVYPRPKSALKARCAPAAHYIAQYGKSPHYAHNASAYFKNRTPPAWLILRGVQSPLSSSQLRENNV